MTYQKQKARFLPCFLLIIFAHTVENFFYLWEDKTIIQYERNSIIMWIADNWKDYEVIDCSKGEKLERWGDYILVRPDPQVIWDTPKTDKGWKSRNGHYHRSKKGGGEWEFFSLPEQWQIHYGSLTFNLKPFNFKHTGLFPEQATNWDWPGWPCRCYRIQH